MCVSTLSLESLVDIPGVSTLVKLEWPYQGAGACLGARDSYQVSVGHVGQVS